MRWSWIEINILEVSYQSDAVVLDVFEDQRGDECSAPLDRWVIWKLSAWAREEEKTIKVLEISHSFITDKKKENETAS